MAIAVLHGDAQVPDHTNGTVFKDGKEQSITEAVSDDAWLNGEFVTTIQKRGAAIINARKASSAMSAANAIGDHIKTWLVTGTRDNDFVSLAVISDGSYGVTPGIVYSFPCTCTGDGSYAIVQDLPLSDVKKAAMKVTEEELLQEKADADEILARS